MIVDKYGNYVQLCTKIYVATVFWTIFTLVFFLRCYFADSYIVILTFVAKNAILI
jgi:hypothetical protein